MPPLELQQVLANQPEFTRAHSGLIYHLGLRGRNAIALSHALGTCTTVEELSEEHRSLIRTHEKMLDPRSYGPRPRAEWPPCHTLFGGLQQMEDIGSSLRAQATHPSLGARSLARHPRLHMILVRAAQLVAELPPSTDPQRPSGLYLVEKDQQLTVHHLSISPLIADLQADQWAVCSQIRPMATSREQLILRAEDAAGWTADLTGIVRRSALGATVLLQSGSRK